VDLDKILIDLVNFVEARLSINDKIYGRVGAAIIDPSGHVVCATAFQHRDGRWVHAERAALQEYRRMYGRIPIGSVMVSTLSPCTDDMPFEWRRGESCTSMCLRNKISRAHYGYLDHTQSNEFGDLVTSVTTNALVANRCRSLAETLIGVKP
jgi:pyrimidine deaminase RibD-like protein